MIEMDTRR